MEEFVKLDAKICVKQRIPELIFSFWFGSQTGIA